MNFDWDAFFLLFVHLAAIASAIAASISVAYAIRIRNKVTAIHVDINSRITQLIEALEAKGLSDVAAAMASGLALGHAEGVTEATATGINTAHQVAEAIHDTREARPVGPPS